MRCGIRNSDNKKVFASASIKASGPFSCPGYRGDLILRRGKYPSNDEFSQMSEESHKLLIACGKEYHHRFWKFLAKDSVLYIGGAFPPIPQISPRCIVIPDSACVAAIIKDDDYNAFNIQHFGPVGRYNSNTVPFNI